MSPVTTNVRLSLNHFIVVSRVFGYVFSNNLLLSGIYIVQWNREQGAHLARSGSFIRDVRFATTFSTAELLNVRQAGLGRMKGSLRGPNSHISVSILTVKLSANYQWKGFPGGE